MTRHQLAEAAATEPARPTRPDRPARPPAVELAAALLIVSGVIGVITGLGTGLSGSTDPFLWVGILLNAISVVLGVATRLGRFWIVTLNYAAVLGFLDILGSATNPQALMVGLAEVLVVAILLRYKAWFDAVADVRRMASAHR